jgi:hypothetical protein
MSSTTYPLAQSGFFNAGTAVNLNIQTVNLIAKETRYNGTGSRTGLIDSRPVWVLGDLPTLDVVCRANVYNEGSHVYGLGQSSTFATPTLKLAVQRYRIRKVWRLFDVTVSGNSTKQWSAGFPVVTGYVEGIAADSTPTADFDLAADVNAPATTFAINGVGTFHGTAKLGQKRLVANFRDGGPILYHYDFNFSGNALGSHAVATTHQWLFSNTKTLAWAGSPVRGTLTLDVGASAGTFSESALCYDVTIGADMANGGPEIVQCRFRVD